MEIEFNLIKRYILGEQKKGDKDQIINWFTDFRFEKDIREKFHHLWNDLTEYTDLEDCEGALILGKIYSRIKKDEFRNPQVRTGMKRFINALQKVAAILFIPLVTYLLITIGRDTPSSTETAYSEIYCPLGTRTSFFLKDGSTGWLNGGSYLKFPTEFRGKTREVHLEGEAYFDVATNPKKPFIVRGSHTSVVAHGTSFNVQAYSDDPDTRITLVTGNVNLYVRKDGKNLPLADIRPGQMCTYMPDKRRCRVETVNTQYVTAWKDGRLTFRDESFPMIVKKINRWYNADLNIMDEALRSYSYQATFMDETLDEVLKLLEFSAPIKYKDLGRKKRPDGTFEKRRIEIYYKPS